MILIVTQCFPPVPGGMENLMRGLADAIAARGDAVTVLADATGDPHQATHDRALAYAARRFGGPRPWRRRRKARAIGRSLDAGSVEAIFTDSWKSAATVLHALRGRAPVPLVSLAHGNDVLTQGDAARAARIRGVLSRVTAVAANSAWTARLVRDTGVDPGRIHVIHPGITAPAAPDPGVLQRLRRRFTDCGPLLLTVARLEPRKGHDQVIRSLPGLLRAHPRLAWIIAGDGPDRARLVALAGEQGVAGRVHFLGRVSDQEKAALFDLCDLFVMPVRDDAAGRSVEGFGLVYIEAAFRGLPAVAGTSGGAAEAVIDGKTGVVCDGTHTEAVQQAIARCLADEGRTAAMGAAAHHRAEAEFAWPVAIDRYLGVGPRQATENK